ncbi:copper chaperone PCu(A)C [Kitasatospora sp. NPDC094015]|uniref:copper chaperone PCu(A)C n=1 Tax=Kitasatospora sp. NPDC094015 TaxID=3155205 RepID=UPI00331CA2EC
MVSDPYIPLPAVAGGMGAGYLTVRNEGGDADQLVSVSSPAATSITLHRSAETTMQELSSLPVPAHGSLELARGGNHLMIMGWQQPPAVGDELELDLTFARSGTISVKVPVKPLTYRPGS